MNKIDFTQPGGFSFDQGILAFLQDSINLAAISSHLGGQTYILSGCTLNGLDVGNGFVVIGGDLLPFVGGTMQEKVVVVETKEGVYFEEEGIEKEVITKRYATFGDDGVTTLFWANFKRNTSEGVLARLERLERISAPFMPVLDANQVEHRGGMVLWKKPANLIPSGWQEVLDWRGRLPIGYNPNDPDFNEVGKAGGAKGHTLGYNNLPRIRVTSGGVGGITGDLNGGGYGPQNNGTLVLFDKGKDAPDQVNHLNPHRVVMFIEYVGV